MFNIQYKRLINWLLPVRLRKINQKAWLKALTKPLVNLFGLFRSFRNDNLYFLSIGFHVVDLERLLNDKFDPGFRRIRVTDAPLSYEPIDIFRADENKPEFVYRDSENKPKPLFLDDETMFGGIDFVIQVPVSLSYDPDLIISTVNKYKTPGRGFIIEEV